MHRSQRPQVRPAPLSAALVSILLASSAAQAQEIYVVDGVPTYVIGSPLCASADLNQDGHMDWLVGSYRFGAPGEDLGRVQARSGLDGSLLYSLVGEPESNFGVTVASIGDVDGDSIADFAVGSPYDSVYASSGGRLSVHSGVDGSLIRELGSPEISDSLGWAITALDDVDMDGVPDFAASALREDAASFSNAGAVRCYSGATGAVLYRLEGTNNNSLFGTSLAKISDLDGDGLNDLLIGDTAQFPETVHVVSGADGSTISQIQATDLFESASFGSSIAAVGDQDGDGFEDILVGAPSDSSAEHLAGLVRLISGASGSVLHEWFGMNTKDRFGASLGSLTDMDGDGRREFLIGAYNASLGAIRMGYVQLYSSIDRRSKRFWPGIEDSQLGAAIVPFTDGNGDGVQDFLVAASENFMGGPQAGEVRLLDANYQVSERYCIADSAACPCGNQDPFGGCANKNGEGARLFAFGSRSLAANDMRFFGSDLPNFGFSVLVVGTSAQQVPLGNGLLCVGGSLQRFPGAFSQTPNAVQFGPGIPPEVQVSGVSTSYFQLWYRDTFGPCGASSNLSNALTVTWLP